MKPSGVGWKFLLSRRSSYWGLRWVSLRNRGLRWAFATLSRPSSHRGISLRLFWENNLQSTSLEEKSWCRYTHYIAGVDQFSLCLTYFQKHYMMTNRSSFCGQLLLCIKFVTRVICFINGRQNGSAGGDQSESCNLGGEGFLNLHYMLVEESDPGPLMNVNGIFYSILIRAG